MLAAEGQLIENHNITLNTIEYDTIIEQVHALFNNEVDVIIYNRAHEELLAEQISNYGNQTKVLHTCTLTEKDIEKYKDFSKNQRPEATLPIEPTTQPTESTEFVGSDTFAVYISGIDVYGAITQNSRSDVNIIAIVNRKTNKVLLVTTPRDFYVQIPGVSGDKKDKLTHAGIYGVDASVNTLAALYDVDINYYLRVNFTSFENIVDALGGISVYSDYSFSVDGYTYVNGYNDLDGKAALRFCRERYSFAAGDNQRGKNQQEAIKAIIKKACSPAILTAANQILDSVRDNIDMNIPEELVQDVLKKQLSNGKEWEVITMAATGYGSSEIPFSMPGIEAYVMIPYEDSVEEIKEAIRQMYK
jgi:LCP family protein required for cell wall assembly